MKYTLMFFLFLIGQVCQGQANKIDLKKYNFADTIRLSKESYVAIGYKKSSYESILVYKRNGNFEFYHSVLTCQYCQGKNNLSTYGGYKKERKEIIFIQLYNDGIDSIHIDFKTKVPVYKKVISHSYESPNEKMHSIDYTGDYLFIPKGSVPITLISTPFDREDDSVKKYFFIKKIKYVDLMK